MSKDYFSAVVIIPPEDKWEPIQKIREKYDRQINRWMPHITLIYPFKPEDEYSRLENDFSAECQSIKPFEISLKHFHYFNHGRERYTLWVMPKPNDLIQDLQARILKIVPECNDVNKHKSGFIPHLSVGQIQGKRKLEETIKNIQNQWKYIYFFLKEIYFISREKKKASKFEKKKRIQLEKE
jgi:2'-5' RNA ligase